MNINRNTDEEKEKKKAPRARYIIWWNDGTDRREYGPIYNRQVALRDMRFYQHRFGKNRAGMEVYDEARDMRRRPRW